MRSLSLQRLASHQPDIIGFENGIRSVITVTKIL